MIRALRSAGVVLMALGVLVIVTWAFEPLRRFWPLVLALPMPVKIGLVIAVFGFAILLGSLIAERMEQRQQEGDLLDDDLDA